MNCLKYGNKIYKPEILFDKIRKNPAFFAKKHNISGYDIEQVLGIPHENISKAEYQFLKESDYDTNGNVKAEVLAEIKAEREKIISQAKANGSYMKAPNGQPTKLNKDQWVTVRTQRFKNWFGDWELGAKEVEIVKGEKHHFKNFSEAKEWAKENIAKTYSDQETGGKGEIRISNTAIDKFFSKSAIEKSDNKDVHLSVLKVLPDVLKNSIIGETHADYLKGNDGIRNSENGINEDVTIHRLFGAVNIDGETYRVKVTLKENTQTKETPKTHSYEATKIELLAGQNGSVDKTLPRYSNNSITGANLLNGVEKSYEKGKFLLDHSKVIDENGEPLVVYHGTPNYGFNIFKVKSLTGIYFTDNKDIADSYYDLKKNNGNSYATFLSIRESYEKDFEGESWNNYIDPKSGLIGDYFVLNQYDEVEGRFKSEKKAQKFIEKNNDEDFELRTEHINNINSDLYDSVSDVKGVTTDHLSIEAYSRGYDGAIYYNVKDRYDGYSDLKNDTDSTIYVVFHPNQIKSATDNVGTFDSGNDDIRYQISESNIEQTNSQFNRELEALKNGTLPAGHIFQLGRPNAILQSAGLPNLPIEMSATRLKNKAKQDSHPFDLSEVENLPQAIQNPIAVFDSSTIVGRKVIFTELQHGDKNFVVAMELDYQKGAVKINDIRSVYPRNNTQIVRSIINNEATYINKEKAISWLGRQQFNSAEATQLSNRSAKVIQNFENPNINSDIHSEVDNDIEFQIGGTGNTNTSPQSNQNKFIPPHQHVMPNVLLKQLAKEYQENRDTSALTKMVEASSWYKSLPNSIKANMNISPDNILKVLMDNNQKARENNKAKKEFNKKRDGEDSKQKASDTNQQQGEEAKKQQDSISELNKYFNPDEEVRKESFIERVRAFRRKWLNNEGGVLKPFINELDKGIGNVALSNRRAMQLIHDLNKQADEIGFTDWDIYLEALEGNTEALEKLPEKIKPFVKKMRHAIDQLTTLMTSNGLVSTEMAIEFEANKGKYLTRAYEFFEGKNSIEDKWKATRGFFRTLFKGENKYRARFGKEKYDHALKMFYENAVALMVGKEWENKTVQEKANYAMRQAQKDLDEYIASLEEEYRASKRSDYRADDSVLKQRQDVPEPIRKLLGEYTDPRIRFALTISKMANMAHKRKALANIREIGMGTAFFTENDINRPSTHHVKISAKGNAGYAPLDGLYTTPEIKEALIEDMPKIVEGVEKLWLEVTGKVKYGKTVLSPVTQSVNFFSNFFILLANGNLDPRGLGEGAMVFYNEVFTNNTLKSEFIEDLVSENIIDSNVNLREAEESFFQNTEERILKGLKRKNPIFKYGGAVFSSPSKLYKASDDFFKASAYYNETNRYAKAYYGKEYKELQGDEREHIKKLAAEVVKNTLPNYNRKYKLADVPRKWSKNILGNFLSYQAESVRIAINSGQLALRDLQSDNPKVQFAGAKRLAGIIAYNTAYYGVMGYLSHLARIGMYGLASAFNDDEEDLVSKHISNIVAPWARSTEKYIRMEDDGTITYFTYGNMNPYGIWYKTMNAYQNGSNTVKGGGVLASVDEFTSSFIEPEMSIKNLYHLLNGENHYGKDLITTGDYIKFGLSAVAPTGVKFIHDQFDLDKKNNAELINFFGVKKYTINPTNNLNMLTNKYTEEMNKLGNKKYSLEMELSSGKISQSDFERDIEEVLKESKELTDEYMKNAESLLFFGANLSKSEEKLNKKYLNEYNFAKEFIEWRKGGSR